MLSPYVVIVAVVVVVLVVVVVVVVAAVYWLTCLHVLSPIIEPNAL